MVLLVQASCTGYRSKSSNFAGVLLLIIASSLATRFPSTRSAKAWSRVCIPPSLPVPILGVYQRFFLHG